MTQLVDVFTAKAWSSADSVKRICHLSFTICHLPALVVILGLDAGLIAELMTRDSC
jgi:hypothetical protein